MAEAAAEGVPPGALSESEIFAQAAKRKEAAVEELTRLQLRVQCVADAYLCSTLHDRCSQLRAAVGGVENEISILDGIEEVEAKKKKAKDDAERASRLDAKGKRAAEREELSNKLRHLKIRISHVTDEHAQASELAARSRGRLAAMCHGLPLMGGSPAAAMARRAVDDADAAADAVMAAAPEPESSTEEAADADLGDAAAAKKATSMDALAAMMAGSDEEEDDDGGGESARPAPLDLAAAGGSRVRRRSIEPLASSEGTGLEGYAGIPADLEAGILAERQVTNRLTRQAGERAEELEKTASREAKGLVAAQDKAFEDRVSRADDMALAEYEQALVIGDSAARMVTDAKRKSQLLQKGADSLSNAKSTMASTDAFQSLSGELAPNQSLNARDFLAKVQGMTDEVMKKKREQEKILEDTSTLAHEQRFQEIWEKVDANGDGHLDRAEITQVFKDMGKELTAEEADKAFEEMDGDGSGEIDFEEAFSWWENQDPEAQAALQESVKAMKHELDELADESDSVARALEKAQGDGDMRERLEKLRSEGIKTVASADSVDAAIQNSAFVTEIKDVVVTYIQSAVAGIDLPDISGSKEWGAYEITGLAIESISIVPENVQIDIAQGVDIKLLNIGSVFKAFQWSFTKDTFPRVKDGGDATAQMVDLSVEISFDIVTDDVSSITVDKVKPVVTLGALNVQVGEQSGKAWLYNKLLKLFSERVKTVVETEMQATMTDGAAMLKAKISEVTRTAFVM